MRLINNGADRRVVTVKSVFSGWQRTLVDAGQFHIGEITLNTLFLGSFDFGENKTSRYFSKLNVLTSFLLLFFFSPVDEMDGYPGAFGGDSSKQQERHYYLLSELQTLVKDLPR